MSIDTDFDFDQYETDMIKEFRRKYPRYNDVPDHDLSICDDGTIWIGNVEFVMSLRLKNYELI